MTTEHITKLLNELENIATANYKKWSIPHATAPDFVTWAQSRARDTVNEVRAAIAQELVEQVTQDKFITAEEARKLGARAELFLRYYPAETTAGYWRSCKDLKSFRVAFDDGEVIKYRAIKKEMPAEPTFAGLKKVSTEKLSPEFEKILHDNLWELYETDAPAEPHAELKAMYEQQVKNTAEGKAGGLDDFVWEYSLKYSHVWEHENPPSPDWMNQKMHTWRCTPKHSHCNPSRRMM